MMRSPFRLRLLSGLLLTAVLAGGLAGCSTPPPPPVAVSTEAMPFDRAVQVAVDALFAQLPKQEGLMAKLENSRTKRSVLLDPTIDATTGQQTTATQLLDRRIAERAGTMSERIVLLPFEAANVAKTDYLMTGTLARSKGAYKLNLALVDIKTGTVAAQTPVQVMEEGVDMSPLPFYRDSPILTKDTVMDGYVRTSAAEAGQKADAGYLARIATASVIADANMLYNAGNYQEALARYSAALDMPAGDQLRVLNGIYLASVKLGQGGKAEDAFGRIVAHGLANKQLGVKFLFNPGSTEFWSDPKVSSAYGMWLRQIVRQASSAKVCMDVVGHTSATGTEAINDALSLKRARFIRQRMSVESADFANRARPVGMGSRQNIVGSGTDDVVDAPDRRVEFAIVNCERPKNQVANSQ
ncbi:Flagellar motor protein MotB [Burkholderiales bacterium 8X]|nr:Flagellar motor protein MotB [Burkholderiales bacterium 8X]